LLFRSGITSGTVASTRTATINSIRHVFALAEVSRLKQGADIEVRFMAVPDDWAPPIAGVFVKEVSGAQCRSPEPLAGEFVRVA